MNTSKTYKVVVDYTKSLSEMIEAGKYDWSDSKEFIKEFFLELEGKGSGQQEAELVLVHLDRIATPFEANEYLEKQGLEPAGIEQLLAFGATYPELHQQFPIIALGSIGVHDTIPLLGRYGVQRTLTFHWIEEDGMLEYPEICRFLAIRK